MVCRSPQHVVPPCLVSVLTGSSSSITHEVARGVYLSLQALPDGGYDLKRVRFAKQVRGTYSLVCGVWGGG